MRNVIIIILLFIFSCEAFSQDSTLIVYPDCYVLNDIKYNVLLNGEKNDNWIEYNLTSTRTVTIIHWDGYDTKTGEKTSGSYRIDIKYGPMTDSAYFKNIKSIKEHCCEDTTFYLNRIPKKSYYISAKGKYLHDKKTDKWEFFYENGKLKKEILFLENIPVSDFNIYRENGTVQFSIKRVTSLSTNFDTLNDIEKLKELTEKNKYNVCRYDKQGEIIDCQILTLEEINKILLE